MNSDSMKPAQKDQNLMLLQTRGRILANVCLNSFELIFGPREIRGSTHIRDIFIVCLLSVFPALREIITSFVCRDAKSR